MAGRKKKSSPALGDDPLSWLDSDNRDKVGADATGEIKKQKPVKKRATRTSGSQKSQSDNKPVTIVLDSIITLAEANDLRGKLIEHIGAGQIQVDASKVEHIDTGGLQLLLALSKAHKNHGGHITWLDWSAPCLSTAKLLGLAASLEMKE